MKKCICLFALVSMSLFLLSGCFPDGKSNLLDNTVSNMGGDSAVTTSYPSKIQKKLNDTLILDASVKIPAISPSSAYQAVALSFDYNKLPEIFLQGKTNIRYEEQRHPITNEITHRGFIPSDGSGVAINYGGANNSLTFDEKVYGDYPYALSMYAYEGWIRPDFREKFPKPSLENIDKEQAVALVKEKLDALNVPVLETPEVYSLDIDSLKKDFEANWKDFENPKYPDGKHPEWTKEREAYVIVFQAALPDGSPITQLGYMPGSLYNDYVHGSKFVGVVGKEGLIFLSISGAYEIQNQQPLSGQIISLDTACEKMASTYDNILLTDPIQIQKISLEYVPRYINAETYEFEIVPAWIFQGIQKVDDEKGGVMTADVLVLIDAVTGAEIPNEGVF